jgi:hypothetical protein
VPVNEASDAYYLPKERSEICVLVIVLNVTERRSDKEGFRTNCLSLMPFHDPSERVIEINVISAFGLVENS